MKKFLSVVSVVVIFLAISLSASLSAQEYHYLKVVDKGDESIVNLRVRPEKIEPINDSEETGFGETGCEPIRTVSFNRFLKAEPVITKKEGFLLAGELNSWRNLSSSQYKLNYLTNLQEDIIFRIGEEFSLNYFSKRSEVLNREESILLWLFVTRIVVVKGIKKFPADLKSRTQEIALLGEYVWRSLYRSEAVSDIWVYFLGGDNYSVNLLIDASGNLITKVMVCPELLYGTEKTLDLFDLVEKSSRELKDFANVQKERGRRQK